MQLSLRSISQSLSCGVGVTFSVFSLLSIACVFGLAHPLSAEADETGAITVSDPSSNYSFDDFKGIWLTEIDGRAVYLLIQRNQIARYFYHSGIDNTVYESRWQLDPERGLDVLDVESVRLRIDPKSNSVSYGAIGEGGSIETETNPLPNRSKIERVNASLLGDWARAPDYETPKNQYMPASYFGYWKALSETDKRSFEVRKNRMVVALIPHCTRAQATDTNEASDDSGTSVLLGMWNKHGQQLHVAWENGAYSIFDNSNPERVKLFDFHSGEAIEEASASYSVLTQSLDTADRKFWAAMRPSIDKKSRISLQHFAQKTLLKFYRGDWIAYDGMKDTPYDILKFGRFGGVELRSNKDNAGTWYPSGKRCTLNFEDGTRMQFQPVGSGFLIFVYEATRPLDAYPNKVLSTAPLDRNKLTWLKSEPSYVLNLLSQWAKVQSFQSLNVVNGPSSSGLQKPSNYNNPANPWWWPIWSDNPIPSSTISERASSPSDDLALSELSMTAKLPSVESEPDPESTRQENSSRVEEPFTPSADPWHWPF